MSDKRPQSTKVLIGRLRRVAVFIDKFKADCASPQGGMVKPEALSAHVNTCWQAAARLEELLQQHSEAESYVKYLEEYGNL